MLSNANLQHAIHTGHLKIEGLHSDAVQPASIDLHLGHMVTRDTEDIDLPWDLQPRDFVLGYTKEVIHLPADLAARVEGVSSLGRLGLIPHCASGFIDPGFRGPITLEIANLGHSGIRLTPGMRICQVAFHRLEKPASPTYSGRYQNQPKRPVSTRHTMVIGGQHSPYCEGCLAERSKLLKR